MWDLAFPGSVMMLKLIFKIVIEQQIRPVDIAKALLAFPVDVSFLSFSFGAAILYSRPQEKLATGSVRDMFVAIVGAIIVLAVTTVFCKKSDSAFNGEKFIKTFFLAVVAYVLSAATLWAALNAGSF